MWFLEIPLNHGCLQAFLYPFRIGKTLYDGHFDCNQESMTAKFTFSFLWRLYVCSSNTMPYASLFFFCIMLGVQWAKVTNRLRN
jgi:hypothetical protein